MVDLITASIPLFFLGIGVEAFVGWRRRIRVYAAADVLCDLALGVLQVLVGIVFAGALIAGYAYLYDNFRVTTWSSSSVLAWVLLTLGVDFLYYWFHRASHRMALAWAAHAPHHSSEHYNLAVALRQGPLQPFVSRVFYLPLALAGFPVEMFVTMNALNTLYQFWIHTELIGKLGPLEWFLNTPSHHRVHHGVNPKYLDKNHAGLLIIWDKMFGTFVEEDERPTYGTVTPIKTFNPLRAWFKPFIDILEKMARAESMLDKLRAPLMPPGWEPGVGEAAPPDVSGRVRHAGSVSGAAWAAFIALMAANLAYLGVIAPRTTWGVSAACALALTIGYGVVGVMIDRRATAPRSSDPSRA